jgi:hypothetical protein
MITHKNIAMKHIAVFLLGLFQIAFELLIVSFAKVDLPSLITPRSDMITCPLIFNALWSSHKHPLILRCARGNCPKLTLDHIPAKMRILKYSLVKQRQSQKCPMSRPDPFFAENLLLTTVVVFTI